MRMHWIDWLFIGVPLVVVTINVLFAKRYIKSVADFLAASRLGGRYLVSTAGSQANAGPIGTIAGFQQMFVAGLVVQWWALIQSPILLIMGLVGFVAYRYRETRVLTMQQFFEIRYSRPLRVFAGFLVFLSGIINFGIFPGVEAQFFVYYCGLPETLWIFNWAVPTFAVLMVLFLSVTLLLTLIGGQLTVMITDCVEGLISGVFIVVVIIALLAIFNWNQIFEALVDASPGSGKSLINPFDAWKVSDFNIWFVLIGIFTNLYGYMTWQGTQGFNCAALNPHEAKMGGILGNWRYLSRGLMITLLGLCTITFLRHPNFAAKAADAQQIINTIADLQVKDQMRAPIAMGYMLPVGIKGILCATILFALIAGEGAYMHSWGSILVQDVILPLRKKPMSPQKHIQALRWAITGVAIFAFLFSLLFKQTEYILMFFAVTGAIIAGLGALVIGGFYWKKGTSEGARTAMSVGAIIPLAYLVFKIEGSMTTYYAITVAVPGLIVLLGGILGIAGIYRTGTREGAFAAIAVGALALVSYGLVHFFAPKDETVNGQWISMFTMLSTIVSYVGISYLTCKEDFNLDRMLHRGKYALKDRTAESITPSKLNWKEFLFGFDKNFTCGDKFISLGVFSWTIFWFVIFLIGVIWNVIVPWPIHWWSNFWYYYMIFLPLIITVATTMWFTVGVIRDLRQMYHHLETVDRSDLDDGRVVGHHNLDDPDFEGQNGEKNSTLGKDF